jgi:hypothetical protein
MREMVRSMVAVACISAALVFTTSFASAQGFGGLIGAFIGGGGHGYGYHHGRGRHYAYSRGTSAHKYAKEEDESGKGSDENASDKNGSEKDANADNKSRRQLSSVKDDAATPSSATKPEQLKAKPEEEPSFSPSR